MAELRLIRQNRSWAPRALAVISCALALLAAQPLTSATAAPKSRQLVLAEKTDHPQTGPLAIHTTAIAQTSRARTQRMTQGPLAASRLHILATLEIFQRLIRAELQPPLPHIAAICWFEPVCIEISEAPTAAPQRHELPLRDLPPPAERAFAIRHCLLAPPLA